MSLPILVAEAVREYRAQLHAEFGERIVDVIVFGSVARGEAHEDSDVDVLVLLDAATFDERKRAIDIGGRIALDHRLPLSPVVFTRTEWQELADRERRFVREVEADGVRP
jgi:predicted nucleotidyltransferase